MILNKSCPNFERFAGCTVYLSVVSTVHGGSDVCSSYGLLGVRSLEPLREERLLYLLLVIPKNKPATHKGRRFLFGAGDFDRVADESLDVGVGPAISSHSWN